MLITVYNEVIPNVVVEGQRKVFEKFGEKIIQIKPKVWGGHAHTVDEYLKNQRKLTDVEPELQILAKDLKDIIIETTKEFKKVLPKGKDADEITKELAELQADKVHKYLVRSFSTFTNPYWNPPKNIRIEARNWVATNVVKKNRDLIR